MATRAVHIRAVHTTVGMVHSKEVYVSARTLKKVQVNRAIRFIVKGD